VGRQWIDNRSLIFSDSLTLHLESSPHEMNTFGLSPAVQSVSKQLRPCYICNSQTLYFRPPPFPCRRNVLLSISPCQQTRTVTLQRRGASGELDRNIASMSTSLATTEGSPHDDAQARALIGTAPVSTEYLRLTAIRAHLYHRARLSLH